MPNLFPSFPASPMVIEQTQPVNFKRSVLFDFAKGDFVRDGDGRISTADGYTAWAQWCQKALATARYAYLAYSNNYGSEGQAIMKKYTSRSARESELKRDITETLMADPRTAKVIDFSFSWEGDSAMLNFTPVPLNGNPVRMGVTINGG